MFLAYYRSYYWYVLVIGIISIAFEWNGCWIYPLNIYLHMVQSSRRTLTGTTDNILHTLLMLQKAWSIILSVRHRRNWSHPFAIRGHCLFQYLLYAIEGTVHIFTTKEAVFYVHYRGRWCFFPMETKSAVLSRGLGRSPNISVPSCTLNDNAFILATMWSGSGMGTYEKIQMCGNIINKYKYTSVYCIWVCHMYNTIVSG